MQKKLDTPMNTSWAGEKKISQSVASGATGEDAMKKKPNFEKVSVSLPPEVHEWIKAEAARRADRFGEHWPASRIVQEAIREYRSKLTAASSAPGQAMPDFTRLNDHANPTSPRPHLGGEILQPHNQPAGGSKTPKTVTYRKAGRAGK